jgi:DNA-binding PadR family transcriptional regulator
VTESSRDRRRRDLLLGEWACLGVLYDGPSHGFAIAMALRPGGELGRVWSLSRALTYRSLDQLVERGLVRSVGEERGIAGGNRTVLAATRAGRAELRRWLATPVEHLRDLRSELLLKLVIAQRCGVDVGDMLHRQRSAVAALAAALADDGDDAEDRDDVVTLWRRETSEAALRVLDHLLGP